MIKSILLILTAITILLLSGCAAGPNEMINTANMEGVVAGFWKGLWHGFIAPITFLISLFSDKVSIYDVHNNGGWYNFGFIFGAMMFFGGSNGAKNKAKSN
jgi:hypothetical protein